MHENGTEEKTGIGPKRTGKEKQELMTLLSGVRPLNHEAMEEAGRRLNAIAKPIGSLGLLETYLIRIAGIREDAGPFFPERSALAVMCGDHGVVEEGVTQTGQEVTGIVAENFTSGQTSVAVMCRISGTDLFPVDMGMIGERRGVPDPVPFRILDRKIQKGTKNLAKEPAMTEEDCIRALSAGISLAGDLKAMGYQILATGEMGIGNTTPSSALASVFLGLSPEEATGRGAGLSDEGLLRKRRVVKQAMERFFTAHPEFGKETASPEDAVCLMAELGGFDLAGMTGLFLGGALHRIPVVMDGFISAVSALTAVRICPAARDFILASHTSSEPAAIRVMEALEMKAPMDFGMHLGEGSGAVALLPVLSMAAAVYRDMSTFGDIQVEPYKDYEGEKK